MIGTTWEIPLSAGWEEGLGLDWGPGGQTWARGSRRLQGREEEEEEGWTEDAMPQNSQGLGTAWLRS